MEERAVVDRGDAVGDAIGLEDVERVDDARRRSHLARMDLEPEPEPSSCLTERQERADGPGSLDARQLESDDGRVGLLDEPDGRLGLLGPEVADGVDDEGDPGAWPGGRETAATRSPHLTWLHPVPNADHRREDRLRIEDVLCRLASGELGGDVLQVVGRTDECVRLEVRGEEALEVRIRPRVSAVD